MCALTHSQNNFHKKRRQIHSIDSITSIYQIEFIFIIIIFELIVCGLSADNLVLNNLNGNPTIQPCDRTRRVFTESQGEISDGPVGFNYTQVSFNTFFSLIFFLRYSCNYNTIN